MAQADILIIFAKMPVYGKVKTRLAVSIGHAAALEIYRQLLSHTLNMAAKVKAEKIMFYSDETTLDLTIAPGFASATQCGDDLGKRMKNAFTDVFGQGYAKAVIVGTDCPAIDETIVATAFDTLDKRDLVIGPAYDGGYYLLGMKRVHPTLFENIPWSTAAVFEKTVAICKNDGLSYSLLPPLPDVDEEKDLPHLAKMNQHG
ncbi:TIGR04282 family arsenosugar biosynthesis glycosyltransferase [Parapedobacter pyrenivorans]|uniref:TIGR04282 family arsenosugar biosynthesis glycosyltransferase n=1 Tax=Parapedobacter pyrenivorans TaxID=1305674 RepID=UPI0033420A21